MYSPYFDPWKNQLEKRHVSIRGGARVSSIDKNDSGKYIVSLDDGADDENAIECDAVVLAVGATAAGRLTSSSPALSSLQATKDFDKLRGVTCVAVRLFLRPSRTIASNLSGGSYSKTQLPTDTYGASYTCLLNNRSTCPKRTH
jgi:predicted flavoprotein YhiN